MVTKTASVDTTLRLSRIFRAPRHRVFRAWTDPEALKKWWGPQGFTTPAAEVDLRVGGVYRLTMKPPAGDEYYLTGTYREVRPPARLVYTWNWERSGDARDAMGETLVTVEFLDRGESTEVVLTHELFPNTERRDGHAHGWNGCFDKLALALDEA